MSREKSVVCPVRRHVDGFVYSELSKEEQMQIAMMESQERRNGITEGFS
jgi:hypothetical protein